MSEDEGLLTVKEAAERLGLVEGTLRIWISRGRVTYHKIGRAVRIPRSEVDRLLAESRMERTA